MEENIIEPTLVAILLLLVILIIIVLLLFLHCHEDIKSIKQKIEKILLTIEKEKIDPKK